jgi:drug/metabolite transporter (DMT)-like permease
MGIFAALLAAFAFALWGVFLQRGLARGAPPRLALLTLALAEITCFFPATLLLAYRAALPPLAARPLALFALAGLLATGVGSALATQATRLLGAARTAAIRLLDPFFAFAIAALFLHESLAPRAILGVAILVLALFLLQMDARRARAMAESGEQARGIALAVAASLAFTTGSVVRKAGLVLLPSAVVAAACEGVAGTVAIGGALLLVAGRGGFAGLRGPGAADIWRSGFAAAMGTLLLNVALARTAVPVAVALRNTSPWFTLLLVPLLLGAHHRATRYVWWSTGLLTVGMLLIVSR